MRRVRLNEGAKGAKYNCVCEEGCTRTKGKRGRPSGMKCTRMHMSTNPGVIGKGIKKANAAAQAMHSKGHAAKAAYKGLHGTAKQAVKANLDRALQS